MGALYIRAPSKNLDDLRTVDWPRGRGEPPEARAEARGAEGLAGEGLAGEGVAGQGRGAEGGAEESGDVRGSCRSVHAPYTRVL